MTGVFATRRRNSYEKKRKSVNVTRTYIGRHAWCVMLRISLYIVVEHIEYQITRLHAFFRNNINSNLFRQSIELAACAAFDGQMIEVSKY